MEFVTCNLLGPSATHFGLGNQMFGVAATLSHAQDTGRQALFPCLKQTEKYGNYSQNIFRNLNFSDLGEEIKFLYKEPEFSYLPLPDNPNLLIEGYFQSEKYFSHNKKLILDTFVLPEDLERYIFLKYSRIISMNNTISVHIRRGDYLSIFKGCFEILDKEYYQKAFSHFPEDSVFVFFGENTEDLEFCKRQFPVKKSFFIQGEKDIVDLFLMSKMKNNIIANSSFSWWPAWLNKNENKKIIAPQKWFAPGHPTMGDSDKQTKDLIPETWKRI